MKKLIIMLAAIAMVGAFTASAMAEVSLYGSARVWTYRVHTDDVTNGAVTTPSTDNTLWQLGPFSRFGAKFKSDKVSGHFEMDARPSGANLQAGQADKFAGSGTSWVGQVRMRILWGEWDFGAGKLGLGHNWVLTNFFLSDAQYTGDGMQDYGSLGMVWGRTSQIMLSFGDLHFALVSPDTEKGGLGAYTTRTETTLPKIEARYDLKLDSMKLSFAGGYQAYKILNGLNQDKTITSYVIGGGGWLHFGPAYLNLGLRYDQNGGNYGMASAVLNSAVFNTASQDIEDTHTWGATAIIGYKVNDMFKVEACYGKTKSKDDRPGTHEDEAQAYGVTATVTLAPGVYIIPEVLVLDKMTRTDSDVTPSEINEGKTTVFGAVWRIDFK
jgi:hypothetical protein